MRKILLVFVSLWLALLAAGQTSQKLTADKIFKTGSGMSIMCKAGTNVELNKDGRLISCTPARAVVYHSPKNFKYVVAPGYPLQLDDQGHFLSFRLMNNAVVETALADHYSALGGHDISLYPSGLVKSFVPKFPIVVHSARGDFLAKAGETVTLYENGTVESFVPAKDISVKDKDGKLHKVKAGTRVELDDHGYFKS